MSIVGAENYKSFLPQYFYALKNKNTKILKNMFKKNAKIRDKFIDIKLIRTVIYPKIQITQVIGVIIILEIKNINDI